MTEGPIKSFDEDLYDRRPIVDRILKRIKSNNYNSLKGQTIVGDYGCGKTSLLNLIEGCIDKKDNIIICKFDSWGRITDAQQGQKLILEKIIEDIGKYTGVSDIKSVPKDYLNSLSGIDSRLKGIIDIINATSLDTEKQLNKIDNTLKAINKKLLVFIEDMDRNNNSEELANDISPLLDRLVCVPNITFIFTIGYDTHISSIINRITNYREDLVADDSSTEKLLMKFRELSINCIKEKTINLDHIYESEILKLQYSYKEAYNAIIFYTKNPRIAKYYLRAIYESWSGNLSGEVDFDDLLMILLLKHCEPSAYDYLIKNIRKSNIKDKTEIENSFKDNAEFFKNTDMASSLIIYILNNNNKFCINRPQSIASCDNGDKKKTI
ncbi:P-loop NTPase fold protein [Photobacterium damselae]|uniref:P-loop NTPase fold protein n=1 Tax=Photobacterium damselae TaxID=38293 RepID=UPI001F2C267C|nr:P-loop NTPase fold protein [Photobacterium damselae]UKA03883.1 KAP family NTPase [Photobacterium damselae subsp. damselae]